MFIEWIIRMNIPLHIHFVVVFLSDEVCVVVLEVLVIPKPDIGPNNRLIIEVKIRVKQNRGRISLMYITNQTVWDHLSIKYSIIHRIQGHGGKKKKALFKLTWFNRK